MIGLGSGASFPAGAQTEWVPGRQQSCDTACRRNGQKAIESGHHLQSGRDTGDGYFVCAAEADGWRPGFNLRPAARNVCIVLSPAGDAAVRATDYLCLCE